MPPQLALALSLLAILWLWWRDQRNNPDLSAGLWIPIAWFSIIGSRFPSEWFRASQASADGLLEGSPMDRNVFLFLLILGVLVLLKRRVGWGLVARHNRWIAVFFLYTAISILWSDFPFTAFKRWHKVFGHVVMALIVWTERDPDRAVASLLRRCSYVLILISVVFIKYFPDLGQNIQRLGIRAARHGNHDEQEPAWQYLPDRRLVLRVESIHAPPGSSTLAAR